MITYLFALSKILDFISTYVGIKSGVNELNPLMRFLINKGGFVSLAIVMALTVLLFYYIEKKYNHIAVKLTILLISIMTILVSVDNIFISLCLY